MVMFKRGYICTQKDARDPEHSTKIYSSTIQNIPSTHKAFLSSFTPIEKLKVVELLKF
jgi:hypothetical protein